MRGRKPKPTQLKDLHGSREPRPTVEFVPETGVETVEPPDHFNDEMRQVWVTAIQHAPPGMLKAIDAPILEAWVVAHVLHRQAVRAQLRHSLVIPAPRTRYPIQSPYLPVINRQALIMMRAAGELGFSPTARARGGSSAPLGGADLTPGRPADAGEPLDHFLARSPSVH